MNNDCTTASFATQNTTNTVRDPSVRLAREVSGTGVGMACEIPRVNHRGSVGDIVTLIMLFISILLAGGLITHALKRRAALGRKEMSLLIGVGSGEDWSLERG